MVSSENMEIDEECMIVAKKANSFSGLEDNKGEKHFSRSRSNSTDESHLNKSQVEEVKTGSSSMAFNFAFKRMDFGPLRRSVPRLIKKRKREGNQEPLDVSGKPVKGPWDALKVVLGDSSIRQEELCMERPTKLPFKCGPSSSKPLGVQNAFISGKLNVCDTTGTILTR